jgi:glyoxylase-like metal-dependent hydrolase (beta-lactamase superfamily II)
MGYYKITDLGGGIYSFFEPLGVGTHLILGEERGLLIDTGYGFVDLRPSIARVWRRPLVVVNTHGHIDHAGGNNQFKSIYISPRDRELPGSALSRRQLDTLISYGRKQYPLLNLLLLYFKMQRFEKYETEALELPPALDLGGRIIRQMPIPGHTPGSVVLLDEQSKTIFAGDAVNNGTFLFFDRDLRLSEYARRLDQLAALGGYERMFVSHGKKPVPVDFIGWYADFLRRVELAKSERSDMPNEGRTVYQYSEESGQYGRVSVFFDEDNLKKGEPGGRP